jgi:hypothetical protein
VLVKIVSSEFRVEAVGDRWAIYNATGQKIKTFAKLSGAEDWIASKSVERLPGFTADQTAAQLLKKIDQLNLIWSRTPESFPALAIFADVVNRMKVLASECRRQIGGREIDEPGF